MNGSNAIMKFRFKLAVALLAIGLCAFSVNNGDKITNLKTLSPKAVSGAVGDPDEMERSGCQLTARSFSHRNLPRTPGDLGSGYAEPAPLARGGPNTGGPRRSAS